MNPRHALIMLFGCVLLASTAAFSGARAGGDEAAAAPVSRASVQRDTKAALVETKLPDDDLGPLFSELEAVMRDYSRWVLEVGPTRAAEEDLDEVVRGELEPILEKRAVALSGQRALLKLAKSRMEAIRAHAERVRDNQIKVKAEIMDADLGDPELDGSVFQAASAFAKERFSESAIPGRPTDSRPAAVALAQADLWPILLAAEMSEENSERLCAAVGDWMEALSLLEDEAKLRSER